MAPPDPKPEALSAYSKIVNAADKLFAAAADLDAAGGIATIASGWTPKSRERAAAVLKSARDALDAQIVALKAANRGPAKGKVNRGGGGPTGGRRDGSE